MTRTVFTLILSLGLLANIKAQDSSTLSLLFMGDIMGHDTQINSARQADGSFDYSDVYKYLTEEISAVDVAIANLEVTLAGPPFKGYPQFSSPDALAIASKNAGIDIFGTANNHSVDRGKSGIIRTINILDSLQIPHMGTYLNVDEKESNTPFIIEQNNIKLALLNYTYGTNGIPVPKPTHVNIISFPAMKKDIEKAKQSGADKIIMYIHWGTEYQDQPNKYQQDVANFCFKNGVDYIIGSHPHVVQKSMWTTDSTLNQEQFITYSMGNFVSNQRKRRTDGGQMIKLVLNKDASGKVHIKESGYLLTWVHTPVVNGKKHFHVLPCAKYELKPEFFITKEAFSKMKLFISDSRNLLNTHNVGVREYLYHNNKWEL